MLNVKQILEATDVKHINGDLNYIVKDYVLDSRNVKKDDFSIPVVAITGSCYYYDRYSPYWNFRWSREHI